MRVLHGMCYSLPAVVMISYLMWLTKSWASGIALTNLLTVLLSHLYAGTQRTFQLQPRPRGWMLVFLNLSCLAFILAFVLA